MKKTSLALFLSFLCSVICFNATNAQNINGPDAPATLKTIISLVSNTDTRTVISLEHPDWSVGNITVLNNPAHTITIDQGTPILKKGAPDLPKLTTSITIPDNGNMDLEIISSDYIEINDINMVPSKGTLTRDIDPATVPYEYGPVYEENSFWPGKLAELREPYILRDFRGQTVIFYPVQYNPVTKVLRIYSKIEIGVKQISLTGGINAITRLNPAPEKIQTDFSEVYKSHFLNYSSDSRYAPLVEQGNMLIICGSSYMSTIMPFVNWKKQKGIPVTLIDVATIGNNHTAIKAFVTNFYANNGLSFLMLIGDNAQVNTSIYGGNDSDNEYGYLAGSDRYPDIFVGRFSAETIAQLQTQIDRTIQYEKNPTAGNWYKTGIGVASDQGPGDDNEYDFEHIRNIRTELMGYNYTAVSEIYDGSQGGQDAAGDPGTSALSAAVNNGASVLNYCGHGSITSLGTTGFANSNVTSLTNDNKLPFVWIVGCQVGNFKNNTCFAEAWMRSTHNGNPVGSVVNMMSTINQDWNEPMEAQDEFNAILTESYQNNIKRTFGGISFNGLFQMNDAYGSTGMDMTDTWVCFGDPSIMIRTDVPATMTVNHAATTILGTSSFTVNCNTDGALVCLTMNNNIMGTAVASGGVAIINFLPIISIDTILVTVTAYNKITYTGEVMTIAPNGPYVIPSAVLIHDPTGNNNSQADYAEDVILEVALDNVGIQTANTVSATISSADPYITITNNNHVFGDILNGITVNDNNAFTLTIAADALDAHIALIDMTIQDINSNVWNASFYISLLAPSLNNSTLVSINDAAGNNNGRMDAGETVIITIQTPNTGSSNSPNAIATLSCSSPYITINTDSSIVGVINSAAIGTATFSITADVATPHGTLVSLDYNIDGGPYNDQKSFQKPVSIIIEDWESNGTNQYNWTLTGDANWFTTTVTPYDGGYCLQSGAIGNSQATTLRLSINVLAADSVIFYKRVDSESGFDFLHFKINNVEKNKWSGAVAWSREAFYVSQTGNVILDWTYDKDNYFSANADAAWLDDIILPQSLGSFVGTITTSLNNIQVYPNPASVNTTIFYSLASSMKVQVSFYNMLGEEVLPVIVQEQQEPGVHTLDMDVTSLAAGIYQCVLNLGGKIFTEKIIVQ